jgi:hypothetical protein
MQCVYAVDRLLKMASSLCPPLWFAKQTFSACSQTLAVETKHSFNTHTVKTNEAERRLLCHTMTSVTRSAEMTALVQLQHQSKPSTHASTNGHNKQRWAETTPTSLNMAFSNAPLRGWRHTIGMAVFEHRPWCPAQQQSLVQMSCLFKTPKAETKHAAVQQLQPQLSFRPH